MPAGAHTREESGRPSPCDGAWYRPLPLALPTARALSARSVRDSSQRRHRSVCLVDRPVADSFGGCGDELRVAGGDAAEVVHHRARGTDEQEAGRLAVRVSEGVRNLAADVSRRTGGQHGRLASHRHLEAPVEDQEGLVKAWMDVQGRPREERRGGVLAYQLAWAGDLDGEEVASRLEDFALAGCEDRVCVDLGVHSALPVAGWSCTRWLPAERQKGNGDRLSQRKRVVVAT